MKKKTDRENGPIRLKDTTLMRETVSKLPIIICVQLRSILPALADASETFAIRKPARNEENDARGDTIQTSETKAAKFQTSRRSKVETVLQRPHIR